MYWRHLNLTAEPFSLSPDPAFLYLSPVHAEAFAAITMGLRERRGVMTMIGEVGTGKTTLVYSLLSGLGPDFHTAYISNARLSFDGILRSALQDFDVPCEANDRVDLLDTFNSFLHRCANEGTTAVLVVDEAQNLSYETFEDLRLLSNFETYRHKLLQIVLVGQPELDTKLRDPALRQVSERVAVRCNVNPLTHAQAKQYIDHRLRAVNGSINLFTKPALRLLVSRSRGIPRSINILCHNALLFAYGEGKNRVTRSVIRGAVREKQGRGLVRFDKGARARIASGVGIPSGRFASGRSWMLAAALAAACGVFGLRYATSSAVSVEDAGSAPTAAAVESASPPTANAKPERPRMDRRRQAALAAPKRAESEQSPADRPAANAAAVAPAPKPNPRVAVPAEPRRQQETANVVEPRQVERPAPETVPAPADTARPDTATAAPALALPVEQPEEEGTGIEPPAAVAAKQPVPVAPAAQVEPAPRAATARIVEVPADPATPPAAAPVEETQIAVAAPPVADQFGTESGAEVEPPDAPRVVTVPAGSSLSNLMISIYGEYDPQLIDQVRAINPQVTDPDVIIAGDRLRFPDTPSPVTPPSEQP